MSSDIKNSPNLSTNLPQVPGGTSGAGPSGNATPSTIVKDSKATANAQRAAQQAGFEKNVGVAEQSARAGVATTVPIPLPYDEMGNEQGAAPKSHDLNQAREGMTMASSRLGGATRDVQAKSEPMGKAVMHACLTASDEINAKLESVATSPGKPIDTQAAQRSMQRFGGAGIPEGTPPGHAMVGIAAHVAGHPMVGFAEAQVAAAAHALTEGARGPLENAAKSVSSIDIHRGVHKTMIPKRNMGA